MSLRPPRPSDASPVQASAHPGQAAPGYRWAGAIDSVCSVLVVEDDPAARKFICLTLQKSGFQVVEADSGEEALERFDHHLPRAALLDLGLPGMDGFAVCRELRQRREDLAILILTGRGEDTDKVSALDLGADDYLVKPFGPEVLVARLRAVLRRCDRSNRMPEALVLGDLRMELLTMKVFKGGVEVDLTPRELALLGAFLRHPGEVLSREQLCGEVWGENHHGSAKALDVFLCKLREKLEDDPTHPKHFRTERGVGFVCR